MCLFTEWRSRPAVKLRIAERASTVSSGPRSEGAGVAETGVEEAAVEVLGINRSEGLEEIIESRAASMLSRAADQSERSARDCVGGWGGG